MKNGCVLEKKGKNDQNDTSASCMHQFLLNNGNEHHLVLDISSATVARMLILPDRVSGIKISILSGSGAKLTLVY